MALYDNPDKISEVLLTDGHWYPVMDGSLVVRTDLTPAEFGFVDHISEAGTRVGVRGPLTSIVAVKIDARAAGQKRRRYVQPDGHLEVLLADGQWHAVIETT